MSAYTDKQPRLTAAQWRMLRALATTGNAFSHLHGRSAHGGGAGTHASLWSRGLIDKNGLTAAGRERLQRSGDPASTDHAQAAGKGGG